ncbi:hypothetical protein [Pseudomonas inefficax]|uniref:hypothetical protein n=1 Tax=Pseudomonas inefficax TaxID=2078786 RepID=UPI003263A4EC
MGRTIGIILSAIILGASLLAAPWGAPLTLGSGLSWAGIAAQGVGLATQIAAKATEKVNPELSKTLSITGWAISLAGTLMSAVGTGMRQATAYKGQVFQPKTTPQNNAITRAHNKFISTFKKANSTGLGSRKASKWERIFPKNSANRSTTARNNTYSPRSSTDSNAEHMELQEFTRQYNPSSNTNAQLTPDQQASGSSSDENRDYQGVVRTLGVSAPKTQSYT